MERIRLIAYRVKNDLSIRNSRFGYQFPPGYKRSVLAEKLYTVSTREGVQRSNSYHYRGLLLTIRGIRGKRRITRSLDTTSTPPITTIARLRLCTHNNTIVLRINTKRRTHEGETRTHSGIGYLMQGSWRDFGLIRTYGAPTLL
jgi:hypothetical protein